MKITIDTEARILIEECGNGERRIPLYSKEGYELLSRQWLRVGWSLKYPYTFSWLGRPVIQLPEDMIRIQEVIFSIQPDVIIETGVAHGGSLVFYAGLCKTMGKGRVIGVEIELRPPNRKALEDHFLYPFISLVDGSSTDPGVVDRVRAMVAEHETILVILDSNHTKAHVLAELDAFHSLVTEGSYIVATDGIMRDLTDVPRGGLDWSRNNPSAAAAEFQEAHPEFEIKQPPWPFNESDLTENVTHWPGAWLRRIS
ncbi:MAG: cephalosporin hydroxylase family protein [Thermoanaerobaculales bacterium]|nr:cephalosporin hydroxylase family protein [Thermoanaerobaculales bacterium]